MLRILPLHKCCVSFQVKDTLFRFKIHLHVKDTPFVGFFWIKDTLNTFWVLSMLRILSLYKFCVSFQVKDTLNKFWGLFMARILPVYTSFFVSFQVKDTLYKFWVLKVKLRDRSGGNGSSNTNIVGGATSVLRGGRTFDPVRTIHF